MSTHSDSDYGTCFFGSMKIKFAVTLIGAFYLCVSAGLTTIALIFFLDEPAIFLTMVVISSVAVTFTAFLFVGIHRNKPKFVLAFWIMQILSILGMLALVVMVTLILCDYDDADVKLEVHPDAEDKRHTDYRST
uniref:Integron gene cassette protein n=1 Tax=Steinernema glaseri TaxID=37863 RepID=A0A1I7YHP3_9BILA